MPDATFACPDLTTFCCLDELGLEVISSCGEIEGSVEMAGQVDRGLQRPEPTMNPNRTYATIA